MKTFRVCITTTTALFGHQKIIDFSGIECLSPVYKSIPTIKLWKKKSGSVVAAWRSDTHTLSTMHGEKAHNKINQLFNYILLSQCVTYRNTFIKFPWDVTTTCLQSKATEVEQITGRHRRVSIQRKRYWDKQPFVYQSTITRFSCSLRSYLLRININNTVKDFTESQHIMSWSKWRKHVLKELTFKINT